MKSLTTFAGTLCLAVVWVLLLPEASALALPAQLPKTGSSLTVPIMLGVVVLCLVIGVVLRAFSKPPAELSLNQRNK
jgi:LPXTG-motif cell wall-anchored protein